MIATMVPEVTLTALDLDGDVSADWPLLSLDEVERARRFRFDVHRRRYVAGRAAVRRTLASVVAADPSELVFDYGEHGRPDLAGHPLISFNLSNSESVGLLVVSAAGRVGVDVEVVRPDFADLRVADRFFAPGEIRRLRALPMAERDHAFFRCWTRKEALLKAHGAGLTLPLREFEVSFEPGQPAVLIDGGPVLGHDRWQLYDTSDLVPGCVAAVAVEALPTTPLYSLGGNS
ncbi:MAG: 4'-phosphopantetheinyl transferase superfamily protein [Actinomycetota bacterium]